MANLKKVYIFYSQHFFSLKYPFIVLSEFRLDSSVLTFALSKTQVYLRFYVPRVADPYWRVYIGSLVR